MTPSPAPRSIESLRAALGGQRGPGFPTFPSETEARAAGEKFLRTYPPAGYGSSYRVAPKQGGYGWELRTYRSSSCD